ncbi:hypothetical protein B1813_13505 [Saccharomonospora piscinae]|uniref:Uncharacterized protein n=1 Tax=Saccharomonospora piscinae TaxID=687388 RepID=A0A1V9A0H6_SACPI|nr:hypothetical protein [Saccharomonospora piscinae]OQO90570.1 hypothetical protein B1813_13505 [Saccharomonospora piscinae]
MSDDPERLLSEALRAQARYAPPAHPPHTPHPTPPTQAAHPAPPAQPAPQVPPAARPAPMVDLSGGYGLLSGAGDEAANLRRAALETDPRPPARGHHRRRAEPLPTRWVLILAASLGMAAGSVLGFLTLL